MTLQSENPTEAGAAPARYLRLAGAHYENFPVGSFLLPRRARTHLHRIYAFARTADDLADEYRDADGLQRFRTDFLAHLSGERDDVPLFRDLRATVVHCALEPRLLTDLLDAFAQDLRVNRYDRDGLFGYCRLSADPVGRLVLLVCGHRDEAMFALSDRICTALQLLNHLQDLGSDLRERDRIYFPREDLQRHGVREPDLLATAASPAVRALVLEWARWLRGEFTAGWAITGLVGGRLRLELRAILRGAAAVLRRIAAVGGDVLGGRVHLRRTERLRTILGGLLPGRPPELRP